MHPRRPDEHFAPEANAAREAGGDVALVDHDVLAAGGDADRAVHLGPPGGEAVYRGWMLRSEQYAACADALGRRGVALRTTAEQYQRAHELPGWYEALATATPATTWTAHDDGFDRARFDAACRALGPGPAVLRDYTKSMKHYWHEAAFIADVADVDAAWKVAGRFRELREGDFTGGFVLRRFETFTSAEVRTWWVGGACRLVTPHPDTPERAPPEGFDPSAVAPLVAALGLPFVTVDFALRADGVWRIIELGDGQVSDRPSTTPPHAFLAALLGPFA